ncbi:glycosyltransferase [Williamsia muralis]|uniref:glycosyltransferase n=1 Tax=Williamsia marianensis TaxID=85044 RepID=UPI003F1649A1
MGSVELEQSLANWLKRAGRSPVHAAGQTSLPRTQTVLHISEAFGGGIQTALAGYIEQSPSFDHRIYARSRKSDTVTGLTRLENCSQEIVDVGLHRFLWGAVSEIRRIEPDIVHLHSSYAGILRLVPTRMGKTLVYSPHCFAFERLDIGKRKRWLYKAIERLAGYRRHTIAAVSPHEAEQASRLSVRARVSVLPNRPHGFKEDSAVNRLKSNAVTPNKVVVTAGRLTMQKDPSFFAAVTNYVSSDVKFVWIGDGDPILRGSLEQIGITVTGWLSTERVAEVFSNAGLYVHTALWEGAPIAPLEALAEGVPTIARQRQVINGLGYTTFGDANELGSAVDRFFADRQYRDLIIDSEALRAMSLTADAQRLALRDIYCVGRSRIERPAKLSEGRPTGEVHK